VCQSCQRLSRTTTHMRIGVCRAAPRGPQTMLANIGQRISRIPTHLLSESLGGAHGPTGPCIGNLAQRLSRISTPIRIGVLRAALSGPPPVHPAILRSAQPQHHAPLIRVLMGGDPRFHRPFIGNLPSASTAASRTSLIKVLEGSISGPTAVCPSCQRLSAYKRTSLSFL